QTGQATGNVTITSSTGFDYRITTSTSNTDIAAGLTTIIGVNITITSGTPENVSLTAEVAPSSPTVHASLNVSNGSPTFHATLSVTTETTSLCDPSQTSLCNLISSFLYTITIIGVIRTRVTHNSTVVIH